MTQTAASVPVVEGLFEIAGGEAHLAGSKCQSCGAMYFPCAISCRNPECREKQVAPCLLPNTGTLYSYTIQHYQPPSLFRIDNWSPYALGVVDLGEGLQVMGMLTGMALEAIEIGMPLHLVVEPLYRDAERGDVLTYKFSPVAEEAAA